MESIGYIRELIKRMVLSDRERAFREFRPETLDQSRLITKSSDWSWLIVQAGQSSRPTWKTCPWRDVSSSWSPYKPMIVGMEWLNDFIGTKSVTFHFYLSFTVITDQWKHPWFSTIRLLLQPNKWQPSSLMDHGDLKMYCTNKCST